MSCSESYFIKLKSGAWINKKKQLENKPPPRLKSSVLTVWGLCFLVFEDLATWVTTEKSCTILAAHPRAWEHSSATGASEPGLSETVSLNQPWRNLSFLGNYEIHWSLIRNHPKEDHSEREILSFNSHSYGTWGKSSKSCLIRRLLGTPICATCHFQGHNCQVAHDTNSHPQQSWFGELTWAGSSSYPTCHPRVQTNIYWVEWILGAKITLLQSSRDDFSAGLCV